jgi:ATP-grasp domain
VADSVVIADPYSSGAAMSLALRRAGFATSAVLSAPLPADVYRAAFRPADFDHVWSEPEDLTTLIADLAGLRPVAVIPGAESGVRLADKLAWALTPDRANKPELAGARRHKAEMLKAVSSAGLPVVRSICTHDPAAARRWIEAENLTGRDLVAKPVESGGTERVTLLPAGAGLDEVFADLVGFENILGLTNTQVLLQERALGVEYAVDTFTTEGKHRVTDICQYAKRQQPGLFAVYDSLEFVDFDQAVHGELVGYVKSALDAVGFRFGPAHTEVIVTNDGPRLMEVGARLAGAGLPGAAALATGRSGIDYLIACLLGEVVPEEHSLQRHVIVTYFVCQRSGTISNIAAYRAAAKLKSCRYLHLNVRDGDHVDVTSNLISTMGVGWAVLAHRDRDQVVRDSQAIREIETAIRIEGEPTAVR